MGPGEPVCSRWRRPALCSPPETPLATSLRVPSAPTTEYEDALRSLGFVAVAGVDEVGRGPLAGPVVAGAVILPEQLPSDGLELLRDSKQLTASQRDAAAAYIARHALAHGCGAASADEIDRIGIVPATRLAMARAIDLLDTPPDHLLVDALDLPALRLPQTSLVKGDARCRSIAAASIIAKVTRDRLMSTVYEERYPGYGFASHKGYGSPEHLRALARLGPTPSHRRTFAPVRALLGGPDESGRGSSRSST